MSYPQSTYVTDWLAKRAELTPERVGLVESVGGVVTHELGIIRAVGATVTPSQLELLRKVKDVRIRENRTVSLSDETAEKTPRGPDGSVDAAVTTVRAPNN